MTRVEAIGSQSIGLWSSVAELQRRHSVFNSLITEVEFWNGGSTFSEFTSLVGAIKRLQMNLPIGAYLGRFDQPQAQWMARNLDFVFVHSYVRDAADGFAYAQTRMRELASAAKSAGRATSGKPLQVWGLFSSEGVQANAGDGAFMGDWLKRFGMDKAEQLYSKAWTAEFASNPAINLAGFQYYEYSFLRVFV